MDMRMGDFNEKIKGKTGHDLILAKVMTSSYLLGIIFTSS